MELISASGSASIGGPRKWSSSRGNLPRLRTVVWVAVFVAALSSAVSAQQYQADKVDPQAFKLGAIAQGCVKDSAKYAASQQQFDDYFKGYYFPAMTQFGPDDLAKLGSLRYDLFNRVLWLTQNEDLQHHLTVDLALPAMTKFAVTPSYHPAVRYNAILVIGMLDEQYGIDTGSNKRPPKPMKIANEFLVKLINAGIKGNAVVTPSLVVGALVGLERHAQYHESLDPAAIDGMTQAAIALAKNDPPLADVDGKVAEWIRVQAATVLAKLGTVGQNNQAHDALVNVLSDSKLSLDSRCEVTGLLALVNYKDAKVDGKSTVDKMLELADKVGQAEAKRAKEFQDLSLAGGAGMSSSRERGGGRMAYGYSASGENSEYDRKTLLSRVSDLRKGFVAIKPVAPADRAPAVETVTSSMQTVIDAAANKDTTDLELVKKVRSMADAIQTAAKGGTATAAAKPAADAF